MTWLKSTRKLNKQAAAAATCTSKHVQIYGIHNLLVVMRARNVHILHAVSNVCACATIIGGICNDLSDTDTSYCAPISRYPIGRSHYRCIPTSQRPLSTMNIIITYQISSSFVVASTTLLLVTFSVEKCFLFQ